MKNCKNAFLNIESGGFESVYQIYNLTCDNVEVLEFSANKAIQQSSDYQIIDIDKDGFDEVVLEEYWFIAGGDMADTKTFRVYPPLKELKIYAVILATSPKVSDLETLKKGMKYKTCPVSKFILSTSNYNLLKQNLFFLGDVVIGKEAALSILEKAKKCKKFSGAYIKRAK